MHRRDFFRFSAFGLSASLAGSASGQSRAASKFKLPLVVSTWDSGLHANAAAWPVLSRGGHSLDAVEAAGHEAEDEPSCCVGLAAYPDRDGKVTLDSCVMDGLGNCGAVSFIDRIKHPVSVARKVMETTPHVMLAGEGARQFALENGFPLESTALSADAEKEWKKWLQKSNYKPVINIENIRRGSVSQASPYFFDDGRPNHDTMGTIAIDASGKLAGMVTTSGMAFKMHGRVGDSPIIGAGLFVADEVGAATSSGVGEEVMRTCGTHTVVEQMRVGRSPEQACLEAVNRIVKRDPAKAKELQVGYVAVSRTGEVGAYSVLKGFTYSVTNSEFPSGKVFDAKHVL